MQFKYLIVFTPHVQYLPVQAKGLKLRPRFTTLRLEASTCACIKKIRIKRRFRGYHSRRKLNKQPMREKDQNQDIHHQFLRELNKVFLPKEQLVNDISK